MKTALPSEPILRAADFSCPFLMQTDVSDTGLGAVLSQVQDGEEHPVVYISRKLSPAEQRYAAVEKEALAVKWAVLELRYYLLGRKFTLITDHAPLQWMARAKDTNARVMSWFLARQDFHFVVRHWAGTANANADGLSRIWAAFAGLSGFIPLPAPVSPFSRGPGTTLWGGGEGCPERSSPSPWKPTRITCTFSSRAGRAHLRLVTAGLDKSPQHTRWGDMSPEDSMLTLDLHLFQKAAFDRPAPAHEHGMEDSHWKARAPIFRGAQSTSPRHRDKSAPQKNLQ